MTTHNRWKRGIERPPAVRAQGGPLAASTTQPGAARPPSRGRSEQSARDVPGCRSLRESVLLTSRKQGTWVYYAATPDAPTSVAVLLQPPADP